MADLLIKHLIKKGGEHSSLALLVNQWGFDEKLIPKALQTVGHLFPHYSRHDESHSKQILVNIERLLGANIELLTATDTWLLLEAAYWHDIGMVVSQQDVERALTDDDFSDFVDQICAQPNHELNRFAKNFKSTDISTCFSGADTPMDAVTKFRELMAEWFRRKHPERSENIVRTPWDSAGISSPRTELIPARLFRLLGRICQMHGAPFTDLLQPDKGLPFREAGLAQEDCHPRFVACLLRMGDLLDMDDNRFCPVMQRIAGEARPLLTRAHEDKHTGIRHLRIDRDRIEVNAECETIDGYLETYKWFDWLKQEIQDQMGNWQSIVPNRALGLLPTLGSLSVRLSGELQILQEGEKPKFDIDGEKTIELLQGDNLYENRYVCIRELLQNAIDASLLRIWLTEQKSLSDEAWTSPTQSEMSAALSKETILVELTESIPETNASNEKSLWTLTIRDFGTGITKNDLAYMLKIGGSHRNTQRQREINRMPEWMKPSGAFGIGLQSAFMISSEISITTKSIFTNEILDITMYKPTGKKEGLVLIRTKENDVALTAGSTITLKFELDVFAKQWTLSFGDTKSIAAQVINSMDPVLDSSFPYEAAVLADQIILFARNSLLPINANLNIKGGERKYEIIEPKNEVQDDANNWRFIDNIGEFTKISYQPLRYVHFAHGLTTFYRGQTFETKNLHFPHVRISIDLMSGKAGAWLNFSRDKLAPKAKEMLEKTILNALESSVRQDLANRAECDFLKNDNLPVYSLFLKAMALKHGTNWAKLADELANEWLELSAPGCTETFKEFFSRQEWTVGASGSNGEIPLAGCDVLVGDSWDDFTLNILLSEWLKKPEHTIQTLGPSNVIGASIIIPESETHIERASRIQKETVAHRVHYKLSKTPQPSYDNAALATLLARAVHGGHSNTRFVLNFDKKFNVLFLNKEIKLHAQRLLNLSNPNDHFVLLPFLFVGTPNAHSVRVQASTEQIIKLSKWTQAHVVNAAELEDIQQAYEELKNYIDHTIMKPSIFWDRWRSARGIDN